MPSRRRFGPFHNSATYEVREESHCEYSYISSDGASRHESQHQTSLRYGVFNYPPRSPTDMGEIDPQASRLNQDDRDDYDLRGYSRTHPSSAYSGRRFSVGSHPPPSPSSEPEHLDAQFPESSSSLRENRSRFRSHRLPHDMGRTSNYHSRPGLRRYDASPPSPSECSSISSCSRCGSTSPEPFYERGSQRSHDLSARYRYLLSDNRPGRRHSVQSSHLAVFDSPYGRSSLKATSQSFRSSSARGERLNVYRSIERRSSFSSSNNSSFSRLRTDRRYPPTSQHSVFEALEDNYSFQTRRDASGSYRPW